MTFEPIELAHQSIDRGGGGRLDWDDAVVVRMAVWVDGRPVANLVGSARELPCTAATVEREITKMRMVMLGLRDAGVNREHALERFVSPVRERLAAALAADDLGP